MNLPLSIFGILVFAGGLIGLFVSWAGGTSLFNALVATAIGGAMWLAGRGWQSTPREEEYMRKRSGYKINCRVCGGDMSTRTTVCPHCGHPYPENG